MIDDWTFVPCCSILAAHLMALASIGETEHTTVPPDRRIQRLIETRLTEWIAPLLTNSSTAETVPQLSLRETMDVIATGIYEATRSRLRILRTSTSTFSAKVRRNTLIGTGRWLATLRDRVPDRRYQQQFWKHPRVV